MLQRASLPGPSLCLGFGALIGPHTLGLLPLEALGVSMSTLLEQAARITLAVGLAGVRLRLPHGYWRDNARWIAVIIGLGMALVLVVAAGVLWWWGLGVSFLMALLVGAIITPTDPVVTTPIVTGSLAEQKVTERVRHNLAGASGVNDGLAYLFVFLPILLITKPGQAWQELLPKVLLWEVLGAVVIAAVAGFVLGKLFVLVRAQARVDGGEFLPGVYRAPGPAAARDRQAHRCRRDPDGPRGRGRGVRSGGTVPCQSPGQSRPADTW